MEISFNQKDLNHVLLSKVQNLEVIKLGTNQIQFANYVVIDKDIDESIPAVLLQLWRFDGGYDHAVINLLESDLGVNSMVKSVSPQKFQAKVEEILSYRSNQRKLTEKEEYFYDVHPDVTSNTISGEFTIPYQCKVKLNDENKIVNLPSWTPLQNLPLERLKSGSILEIWSIDNVLTVMKVIKL